uniref:Uncharacterized protein n=1 Tax=Anguilla anguilla TaxID=7936 RepID=A0A0E9UHL8_ANGAN
MNKMDWECAEKWRPMCWKLICTVA